MGSYARPSVKSAKLRSARDSSRRSRRATSFGSSRRAGALALLSATLAGALALGALPARAEELPRVALAPVVPLAGVPERSAVVLTDLMRAELATRDAELRLVATAGAGRKGGAREAAALFEQGQGLLADLQFGPAATAFTGSVEAAMADPANADFKVLREALIGLAVARFRAGQEKEARAALAEVSRLDPSYRLPAGRYPPVFVRAFEKARRGEARARRGVLVLDGPSGWTVFVDGRAGGPLPAKLTGLRHGPHLVRAEGPQGERAGQVVTLSSPSVEVELDLSASLAPPAPEAELDAEAAARLDSFCRLASVDFVLVAVLYRAGEVSLALGSALYSARAGGFTVFPPVKLDESLATANVEVFKLGELVSAAIAHPGELATPPIELVPRPKPPPVAEVKPPAPKLIPPEQAVTPAQGATALKPAAPPKKGPALWAGVPWWVWVAGGVGAAAVAGGTYYGVSQANRRATGTVNVSW